MASTDAQARFEPLKRDILELGFVRPGNLVRRLMPCDDPAFRRVGKPLPASQPLLSVELHDRQEDPHDRLSEEQARLCQHWVRP